MESDFHFEEYISILKRRFLYFLIPFVLIASVGGAFVILIPPVYQSTGVILVESQQIPTELIKSTITSYADERIQVIRQRVMTRSNLMELADKFQVFKGDKKPKTTTETVDLMREKVSIALSSHIGQRRPGAPSTIAFNVSFEDENPQIALSVTNELITLFLDENISTRTERATETTSFLSEQAHKLKQELESIEQTIAQYKQENSDALPEHLDLRLNMLERAQRELKSLDLEKESLEEEKRFFELEATSLEALAQSPSQTGSKTDYQTLKEELRNKKSVYGAKHPDVKVLQRKLDALSANSSEALSEYDLLQIEIDKIKEDLFDAEQKYAAKHPDIKRLKTALSTAQIKLSTASTKKPKSNEIMSQTEANIAKVNLGISSIDAKIRIIFEQRQTLVKKIEQLEAQIIKIPQVERALISLSRDYENSLSKYEELKAKELEAKFSESLETEQKAERFSLLEPPIFADTPIKPNRKKLGILLLALACAAGGGLFLLVELIDRSVRGVKNLEKIIPHETILTVPYIVTEKELRRKKRIRISMVIVFIAVSCATVISVHIFYKPLDILFYKILNRLS